MSYNGKFKEYIEFSGAHIDQDDPHGPSNHIFASGGAKLQVHAADTQFVGPVDLGSNARFAKIDDYDGNPIVTQGTSATQKLIFDANATIDFNNCTIQNLAVGGSGNTLSAQAIASNNYANQSVDYELDQLTSAQGTINNAITGLSGDKVMVSSGGGNLVPSSINPSHLATTTAPNTFQHINTFSQPLEVSELTPPMGNLIVNGDVDITGGYKVGSTPLESSHLSDGTDLVKLGSGGDVSIPGAYQVAGVPLNSTHLSNNSDILIRDPNTSLIHTKFKGFDTTPSANHTAHFEFRHEASTAAPSDPATSRLNVVSKFDTDPVSGVSYIDKPLMTLHSGLRALSEETVYGLTTDVLPTGVSTVDNKSGHVQFQRDVQMLGDPATTLHLNDRDASAVNTELGITDARTSDCYPRLQRTRTNWYNSLVGKALLDSQDYTGQLPSDTTEHPHDRFDSLQFTVGKRGDFRVNEQSDRGDAAPILMVGRDLDFSVYKDSVTPSLRGLYSVPFLTSGNMKETDWNTMTNPTLSPNGCDLQPLATRNWCMNSGQLSGRFHKYVIELCSQGLPNANPAVGDLQADFTSHRTTWPEWNSRFEPIRLYGEKQTADPNQTPTPGAVDFTNPRLRQHELGHSFKNPITITENKHVWKFRNWPYEAAEPNQNKYNVVANANDQFVYNFTVGGVPTTKTVTIPVKTGGYSLFELFNYIKTQMTQDEKAQLTVTADTRPDKLECTIATGPNLEILFQQPQYIRARTLMALCLFIPANINSIPAGSSLTGFSAWMTKVKNATLPEVAERVDSEQNPVPNEFTVDCTSTMSQIELKANKDITRDDGTGTQSGGLFARLNQLQTDVTALQAQVSPTVFDIDVAATTSIGNPKLVLQPNVNVSDPVKLTVLEVGTRRLCSLKGLVQRGTGNTNTHLLTLPSGYRPSTDLRFACPVFSNDGFRAIIVEASTGNVFLHSNVLTGVEGNSIGNNTVTEDDRFTGLDPIQFWT